MRGSLFLLFSFLIDRHHTLFIISSTSFQPKTYLETIIYYLFMLTNFSNILFNHSSKMTGKCDLNNKNIYNSNKLSKMTENVEIRFVERIYLSTCV